jgi:hypothetical protein
LQIITSLKEKKLNYDGKLRCDSIQGCFIGVKFKTINDDFASDDEEEEKDYKSEYFKLLAKFNKLKNNEI